MANYVQELRPLIQNIEKVILGKTEEVKFLIVGLLTNGHVLIEDVPGTGKTTLSLALAKSINADFKRIQFTPDLLPSDVTGGFIYNAKTAEFEFKKGPVFTNILLADEINRTTPRTQSALLECMQEFKLTLDGTTFELAQPFMVIATENPIEFQGTYPLPESQIDRFLLKISMGYLSNEEEVKVIAGQKLKHPIEDLKPVMDMQSVLNLQLAVRNIEVSKLVLDYIVKIVSLTRHQEDIKLGASARASIALMKASSAWAMMEGRDYVVPEDVVRLLPSVLKHRIVLQAKAAVVGKKSEEVIAELVKTVAVP